MRRRGARSRTSWNVVLGRWLYLVATLSFIGCLAAHGLFYAQGYSTPFPGHTFPLSSRGGSVRYISERQAQIMYAFLGAAVLSGMFGFLLANRDGIADGSASEAKRDSNQIND